MPNHLKVIISVAALLVTSLVFYLDTRAGMGASRWVVLGLGPLMVFAIWIFPEAKLRELRADAAQRRVDSGS